MEIPRKILSGWGKEMWKLKLQNFYQLFSKSSKKLEFSDLQLPIFSPLILLCSLEILKAF